MKSGDCLPNTRRRRTSIRGLSANCGDSVAYYRTKTTKNCGRWHRTPTRNAKERDSRWRNLNRRKKATRGRLVPGWANCELAFVFLGADLQRSARHAKSQGQGSPLKTFRQQRKIRTLPGCAGDPALGAILIVPPCESLSSRRWLLLPRES